MRNSASATIRFLIVLLGFAVLALTAQAQVVIDDEFDDGDLTLNLGTGSGFQSLSQEPRNLPVTESGGVAVVWAQDSRTGVLQSVDTFDPFTGDLTEITWTIQGFTPSLPQAANRTWVGIREATSTSDHFLEAYAEGFYIGINSPSAGYGYDFFVVSRFGGQNEAVLAGGTWDTYDGSTPLEITLRISGNSYDVDLRNTLTYSEQPVTLTTGSLSGTIPDSPSGSYRVGAHHQALGASPAGGLNIDRIQVAKRPLVTAFADAFDDISINTNPGGDGNGFLRSGRGAVTETGGQAVFAPANSSPHVIESVDTFDPFTGDAVSVTWQIADLGIDLPPTLENAGSFERNRTWLGIRPAVPSVSPQGSFMPLAPSMEGLFIGLNNYLSDGQAPISGTRGVIVAKMPGRVQEVLAEFDWSSWDGRTPLTATLVVRGGDYAISFSEDVNLAVPGSLTGTITGAPVSGTAWVAGVHYQNLNTTGSWGTLLIDSIRLDLPLVVTNTDDSGAGSLRDAIQAANTNPGLDTITFAIPGNGVKVISPTTALDAISEPVIIDGFSQPGASPNTAALFQPDNAVRLVQLDGSAAGAGVYGLHLSGTGTGSRVSGLDISEFGAAGVLLEHGNSQISGNLIRGNGINGVDVEGSANTIGGPDPADRNILVGNLNSAVGSPLTDDLVVQGNFIGLEGDGLTTNGNFHGFSGFGLQRTKIIDNVISGSTGYAMEQVGFDFEIIGNRIGTSSDGTLPRGNGGRGIFVWKGSVGSLIKSNLIAFNSEAGIDIYAADGAPQDIVVSENEIYSNGSGTTSGLGFEVDATGGANGGIFAPTLANAVIDVSGDLTVDVNTPAAGTVELFVADGNQGRTYIGAVTMSAGSSPATLPAGPLLPTQFLVATLTHGSGTTEFSAPTVAMSTSGIDPLIVTNVSDGGVGSLRGAITYSNANENVSGSRNKITFALDLLATETSKVIRPQAALPVITTPVEIDGISQADGATCGTSIPDRVLRIVLDGSDLTYFPGANASGLEVGADTDNVTIRGLNINQFPGAGIMVRDGNQGIVIECNFIGTDEFGNGAFGNFGAGVEIQGYTSVSNGFRIGGPDPEDGNLISSNGYDEIHLEPGADSGFIQNNFLGTNRSGTALLPASSFGVPGIDGVANREGIGSNQGAGNTIVGNVVGGFIAGISLVSSPAGGGGNVIQSNFLGTDLAGTEDLGNALGISVSGPGPGAQIIGGLGVGNTIKFNDDNAIEILGGSGHFVTDNAIFDNGYAGIWLADGANGVTISGNKLGNNFDSGIVITAQDRFWTLTNPLPAFNNTVSGNVSGLDAAGNAFGNGREGLAITFGAHDNTVTGNTFSSNGLSGVVLWEPGDGNELSDNWIGTGPNAPTVDRGNGENGIIIGAVDSGSLTVIDGNTIAYNLSNGILIKDPGQRPDAPALPVPPTGPFPNATITANSIFSNARVGIDLSAAFDTVAPQGDGQNQNDTGDGDVGPNGKLNYPILLKAKQSERGKISLDLLLSRPTMGTVDYTVEVFLADSDGQEGKTLVYSEFVPDSEITSNQSIRLEFDDTLLGSAFTLGDRLVATATDANGYTSEFSPPVTVDNFVPRGYVSQTVVALGTIAANSPRGVAAANGDAFVVASNETIWSYPLSGPPVDEGTVLGAVDDIVLLGTDIYVIHGGDSVERLQGSTATVPGVSGGAVWNSELYVVAGNEVRVSRNAGATFSEVYATLPTGLTGAGAIVFGKDGTAYVGASSSGVGQVLRLPASDPNAAELMWTLSGHPSSLAFAEDGRLFLTTQKQVLYGFPSSPQPTEFMALPDGGGNPNSLAIGPNSRLFVAHEASGDVYRFSLPKTQEVEVPATAPEPLTFVLSNSLRDMLGVGQVAAAVTGALATWESVDPSRSDIADRVVFDAGTSGRETASIGDMENTIALSNDRLFLGSATLGVASKLLKILPGGTPEEAEVVSADILLNSRFRPGTGNSAGLGVFTNVVSAVNHDVQGVITHEMGHVLGLVHSSRPDATMFYSLPYDARDLTVDDEAAILRQTDATVSTGYGTISGTVTGGVSGALIGGALVMATRLDGPVPENIHAYTDRSGAYTLSFLPEGQYQVGLFALDGSVFSSKLPLTPARISRYLDTIANERTFLEEYWNDTNESADDDRSEIVEITVSSGSPKVANFLTNIDTTPPKVSNVSVGSDPNAASLSPRLGFTFSERVVASSIKATVRPSGCQAPCGVAVPVVLEKSARKIGVANVDGLTPGTSYVISVSGLRDDAGNVQTIPFSSVFTTRPIDGTPPVVSSSTPAAGATGVSTATLVAVTFSEPIKPSTVTGGTNVVLREAAGGDTVAVAVSIPANNVISLTPANRLSAGTSYEVVLSGLKDYSDNTLAPTTLTFFTEPNPLLTVDEFGPSDMAGNVALETSIFIDFSEAIQEGDTYPVRLLGGQFVASGSSGSAELQNDGKRLVFIPASTLLPSTTYTFEVLSGIYDAASEGSPQREEIAPFSWTFITGGLDFSWTSLSPSTGSIGALVTLEGSGFDPNPANNLVEFTGGGAAEVVYATGNAVTVVVPDMTTDGPVTYRNTTKQFKLYVEPETFDTAVKTTGTDDAPSDVDVAPDGTLAGVNGPLAVVPNAKSNTVSLIEIATGIEKSVVVGDTPLRVSVTPDGSRAYVSNFNSHTVSAIDLACAWQSPGDIGCLETIPVGFNPLGIDVSDDGSRVYVANYSSYSVSVIDAEPDNETFNQAVRTIGTDDAVTEVFTDPDGGVRWLASEAGNTSTNPEPDGTLRKLQEDAHPTDVNSNPDGTGVFIGTGFGLIAAEVNFDKPQADWAVKVLVSETHPSASDIDPDGGVPKIGNEANPSSTTTDPDGAGRITATESSVSEVESSPDGALIHLVMGGGDLLVYAVPEAAYEGAYQAVAKTGVDAAASSVATSPDGALLYVTSYETSTVSIYKLGAGLGSADSDPIQVSGSSFGLILIAVQEVGLQPEGIAYSPENNLAVVANSGSDNVTVLNFNGISGFAIEADDVADEDANDDGIPDSRVDIVEVLEGLVANSVGKDQKDYEKALKHAEDNLDPKQWDENAEPSEKHGKKVFDNDKQIVKALAKVIDRDGFESTVAAELLDLTFSLDLTIVEDAISAAESDLANLSCELGKPGKKCRKQQDAAQKEIDKAIEEVARAGEDFADGKYDKAIDHYKKAWTNAGKAADDVAGKGAIWEDDEDLPVEFALSQNYPNPFNPVTTVEFALPETAEVRLEVFDVLGRRVHTLVNGKMDAGYHSVQFNAERLASGIYLYRIQAGAYVKVHRMVLMK